MSTKGRDNLREALISIMECNSYEKLYIMKHLLELPVRNPEEIRVHLAYKNNFVAPVDKENCDAWEKICEEIKYLEEHFPLPSIQPEADKTWNELLEERIRLFKKVGAVI